MMGAEIPLTNITFIIERFS